MPSRRRTEPSKHTHSTSPTTSTSHGSADTHRLRHTGPSITTRSRSASFKPSPSEPTSEAKRTAEIPHEKMKPSPPGARAPLTKFLYVVLIVVLSLFGWYIYGMITLLGRLKEEVGWWGIIVGDSGGMPGWVSEWRGFGSDQPAREGGDLDSTLNALADALGVSPAQVASAVRPLVPEASLTSMASKSEESGRSEVVRILLEDTKRNDDEGKADATRIMREFAERFGGDAADEDVAEEGVPVV